MIERVQARWDRSSDRKKLKARYEQLESESAALCRATDPRAIEADVRAALWSSAMSALPSAWLNTGSRPPASYAVLQCGLDRVCPDVLKSDCPQIQLDVIGPLWRGLASEIVTDFRKKLDKHIAKARYPLDILAYLTCRRCQYEIGWAGSQRLFSHSCVARPMPPLRKEKEFWSMLGRPGSEDDGAGIDRVIRMVAASTGADRRALALMVDESALRLRLLPPDSRAALRLSPERREWLQSNLSRLSLCHAGMELGSMARLEYPPR